MTWHLGRAALIDLPTIAFLRFNMNSALLVLGEACAGLMLD